MSTQEKVIELQNEIEGNKASLAQLITSLLTMILFVITLILAIFTSKTELSFLSNNITRGLYIATLVLFIVSQIKIKQINKEIKDIDSTIKPKNNAAHIVFFAFSTIAMLGTVYFSYRYIPLIKQQYFSK